jgi:hypothetical protein
LIATVRVPPASDPASGSDLGGARKISLPQIFGAEFQDRIAAERVVRRQCDAGGAADARSLLDCDDITERVHRPAAVRFRNQAGKQTHLSERLHVFVEKTLFPIERRRRGLDLLQAEGPDLLAILQMFLFQHGLVLQ